MLRLPLPLMDAEIFELINRQLANPVMDVLMPIYRDKLTWVPFYLIASLLIWRTYGSKRTLYLILCIGIIITVADQLAASVLKPWVGRLRPCAEAGLADRVRILVGCGGKYGFPSNHAVNHFALATVLALTWLRHWAAQWKIYLFIWAASIGLAQIYVGKHYPGDVVAGAALGAAIAVIGVVIYRYLTGPLAIGHSQDPLP